jgi:hypothetical protein
MVMLEESEGEILDDSADSESDEAQKRRPNSAKRRRSSLRSTSCDIGEYDQDEAALQQAIALSMEGILLVEVLVLFQRCMQQQGLLITLRDGIVKS